MAPMEFDLEGFKIECIYAEFAHRNQLLIYRDTPGFLERYG